jgi:hypothetical protein
VPLAPSAFLLGSDLPPAGVEGHTRRVPHRIVDHVGEVNNSGFLPEWVNLAAFLFALFGGFSVLFLCGEKQGGRNPDAYALKKSTMRIRAGSVLFTESSWLAYPKGTIHVYSLAWSVTRGRCPGGIESRPSVLIALLGSLNPVQKFSIATLEDPAVSQAPPIPYDQ